MHSFNQISQVYFTGRPCVILERWSSHRFLKIFNRNLGILLLVQVDFTLFLIIHTTKSVIAKLKVELIGMIYNKHYSNHLTIMAAGAGCFIR